MAFHYDWFKGHIPSWEQLLKRYKNKPNLLFLEVGCFEGRATLWLCQNILTHNTSKIFVVDTFKGSIEHSKKDAENLLSDFKENLLAYISSDLKKSKVLINIGLSEEVLKKLRADNPNMRFDFVYVDGAQTARNVLEDTLLSWALLKNGGMMILNDYGWRLYENPILCPYPAIEAFLKIFDGQYKVVYVGYQIAIIKLGDNIPLPKKAPTLKNPYPWQENGGIIKRLENDLNKIHSSRAYKIWQKCCQIRDSLKSV